MLHWNPLLQYIGYFYYTTTHIICNLFSKVSLNYINGIYIDCEILIKKHSIVFSSYNQIQCCVNIFWLLPQTDHLVDGFFRGQAQRLVDDDFLSAFAGQSLIDIHQVG